MDICIIGGGIIGLSTAIVLQRNGQNVTIFSDKPYQQTTSWAAAALGYPVNIEETQRCKDWFKDSLIELQTLEKNPESGVSLVEWLKCTESDNFKMPFWSDCVPFAQTINQDQCPTPYKTGLYAKLYLMNVDQYFPFLLNEFKANGGRYTVQKINTLDEIPNHFDVTVNCTGIDAKDFTPDHAVTPARGQVIVVKNPNLSRCISTFEGKNYIYPRGETCVLGGSYEINNWETEPDHNLTEEILHWAQMIEPKLKDAEILDVRVGLRPLRETVRLELDPSYNRPTIHNYGHGGAGYTLSWGCARNVLHILKSPL